MNISLKTMDMGEVSTKSTKLEEVDLPQDIDLLNKWTIPKVDLKTIYEYGFFDNSFEWIKMPPFRRIQVVQRYLPKSGHGFARK